LDGAEFWIVEEVDSGTVKALRWLIKEKECHLGIKRDQDLGEL
jgi:hypothetical protein